MNKIKELILKRLYQSSSICLCCHKQNCVATNRKLPSTLDTDKVLKAINLDEHFFKEEVQNDKCKIQK